jgi:hypothetical protein
MHSTRKKAHHISEHTYIDSLSLTIQNAHHACIRPITHRAQVQRTHADRHGRLTASPFDPTRSVRSHAHRK